MIYLKRSKRPSRGRRVAIAAAALVVIVFVVGKAFPSFYPKLLYPVGSVFWGSESTVANWFVDSAAVVQSKYALVEENRALREEVAARDEGALLLSASEAENAKLKAGFGRAEKPNDVLASILVRPPVSPYDTLIVDAGTREGVAAGDKVYAEGGIILGDVLAAYAGQSEVALYSSPGRTTSVLVGTSSIAAEAAGEGGGSFILKLPVDASVTPGAIVTLPGMRTNVFGLVESVTPDPTDSLATVLFRSPANVSQLRYVLIDRSSVRSAAK